MNKQQKEALAPWGLLIIILVLYLFTLPLIDFFLIRYQKR